MLITGCSQLPERPGIWLCTIRLEDSILVCSNTEVQDSKNISIEEANRFIAISPDDWKKVSFYIKDLKNIIEKQCRK